VWRWYCRILEDFITNEIYLCFIYLTNILCSLLHFTTNDTSWVTHHTCLNMLFLESVMGLQLSLGVTMHVYLSKARWPKANLQSTRVIGVLITNNVKIFRSETKWLQNKQHRWAKHGTLTWQILVYEVWVRLEHRERYSSSSWTEFRHSWSTPLSVTFNNRGQLNTGTLKWPKSTLHSCFHINYFFKNDVRNSNRNLIISIPTFLQDLDTETLKF